MIIAKGSFYKAQQLLLKKKNTVSYVYSREPKKRKGILADAVFTIKDNFATKNYITTSSSKILSNFIPGYDATVIKKIKSAGGKIVAKVYLDELGLGGSGLYSAFGKIVHPQDSSRISGGSSSGSVATFNSFITFSLASDTGDSVRLPASYNGIVGFKPSYGAVSRYGLFSFASSLDTVAWFAHNVSDTITLSQALFGKDKKDMTSKEVKAPEHLVKKPKVVAYLVSDIFTDSQKAMMKKLIEALKEQKITVKAVTIDEKILNLIGIVYDVISFSEASSNDANLSGIHFGKQEIGKKWNDIIRNSRSKNLGFMVQKRFFLGALFLHKVNQKKIFLKAQKVRRLIKYEFSKIFRSADIFIYPSAKIAPKITEGKEDNWYSYFMSYANLVGNPSLSIPFGKEEDMPFGLTIDCNIYNDAKLLSHALYIEKILGEINEQ